MLCKSFDKYDVPCREKAVVEVFWPSQKTFACERHYAKMKQVAEVMGFMMSARLLPQGGDAPAQHSSLG
jgi:hypothetical protein